MAITIDANASVISVDGTSTSQGTIRLYEDTDNGTNYIGLQAPASVAANVTFALPSADGTANQALITNGSAAFSFLSVAATLSSNTFTAAQTFRAANAVRSEAAATQDAIVLAGRAGGTSSYAVTLTPTTLAANRTVTLADGDVTMVAGTMAVLGTAQTFTEAQTFRAANSVRAEAASTQDAIVLAGRAGGTSSYAITLTPATLSSSTTLTLPNVTSTVAILGTAQTFTADQTITGNLTLNAQGNVRFADADSSNYVALQAPSVVASNLIFTLPSVDGSSGNVLQTNGAGTLSFGTVTGLQGSVIYLNNVYGGF